MSEREVKTRVKLLLISMCLRPDRRGFVLLVDAITTQAMHETSMNVVYRVMERRYKQTRACMERSMRLCIGDLDREAFARQINEITGYNVISESVKVSCNCFIAMMAEVLDIAYGLSESFHEDR